MYCPNSECNCVDNRVLKSYGFIKGRVIRRERECLGCYSHFTTYEISNDDMKNKEIMKAFNRGLTLELETETFNQIEMIKKELDNVSMRIKKIK